MSEGGMEETSKTSETDSQHVKQTCAAENTCASECNITDGNGDPGVPLATENPCDVGSSDTNKELTSQDNLSYDGDDERRNNSNESATEGEVMTGGAAAGEVESETNAASSSQEFPAVVLADEKTATDSVTEVPMIDVTRSQEETRSEVIEVIDLTATSPLSKDSDIIIKESGDDPTDQTLDFEIEDFQLDELQCDDLSPVTSKPLTDPIERKLINFMKDATTTKLEFDKNISDHERFLVHKFVTENGLICESTGSNVDHAFVVYKDIDIDDDGESQVKKKTEIADILRQPSESDMWAANINPNADVAYINHKVSMRSLGILGPFTKLIQQTQSESYWEVFKTITLELRIPLKVVMFRKPETKLTIFINNIRVADGFPSPDAASVKAIHTSSKNDAAKNALCLLISRGLKILVHEKLNSELCSKHEFNSLGQNYRLKGEIEKLVKNFILDPNKLKIIFVNKSYTRRHPSGELTPEVQVIIAVCTKYQLVTRHKSGLVMAWKTNSAVHNVRTDPLIDISEEEEDFTGQQAHDLCQDESSSILDETDGIIVTCSSARDKVEELIEESNVNNANLKLASTNMEDFQGIFDIEKGQYKDFLLEITRLKKVPCKISVTGPFSNRPRSIQWEATMTINNVFISKLMCKTAISAQKHCARNGYNFLVSKGLKIVERRRVKDENITSITRDMLVSGKQTVRGHLDKFINNEKSVKITFPVDANECELEVIDALAQKHGLKKTYEGTGCVSLWKKNSVQHKMNLCLSSPSAHAAKPSSSVKLIRKRLIDEDPYAIRNAVEKFVRNPTCNEIQFDKDLNANQKDLIEILAEKYELIIEFDQSSGYTLLSKRNSVKNDKGKQAPTKAVAIKRARSKVNHEAPNQSSGPPKKKVKDSVRWGLPHREMVPTHKSALTKFHQGSNVPTSGGPRPLMSGGGAVMRGRSYSDNMMSARGRGMHRPHATRNMPGNTMTRNATPLIAGGLHSSHSSRSSQLDNGSNYQEPCNQFNIHPSRGHQEVQGRANKRLLTHNRPPLNQGGRDDYNQSTADNWNSCGSSSSSPDLRNRLGPREPLIQHMGNARGGQRGRINPRAGSVVRGGLIQRGRPSHASSLGSYANATDGTSSHPAGLNNGGLISTRGSVPRGRSISRGGLLTRGGSVLLGRQTDRGGSVSRERSVSRVSPLLTLRGGNRGRGLG